MKKFLFCAAALLAAISFSACSDSEDDGPNINTAKLLGKWVALARYDYVAESDSYVVDVEFNDYYYPFDDSVLNFQDEKTVLISDSEKSEYIYTNTYTLNGARITLHEEATGYTRSYKIILLTDTQMELWKKDIDDDYKILYERKTIN